MLRNKFFCCCFFCCCFLFVLVFDFFCCCFLFVLVFDFFLLLFFFLLLLFFVVVVVVFFFFFFFVVVVVLRGMLLSLFITFSHSGDGPFTILAPNNAAFDKLPAGYWSDLFNQNYQGYVGMR